MVTNYTPSYPINVLKFVKIGGVDYALKDETLRALIAGMNPEITENSLLTAISGESADADKLVTNEGIKNYVDAQVGAIHAFDYEVVATLPTPSADTMFKIYLVAEAGVESGSYVEYITVRSGSEGAYTYAMEKIGTTAVDLDEYLQESATVAGVSFGATQAISSADLSTALDLKALAHKDNATGTVAGQDITGVEATGSTTGSITVTVKDASAATEATLTRTDLTVSGSITGGKTTASGTVALEAGTSADAGAIQLSGTISKPDVTITPASDTIKQVATLGTQAAFTEGAFSAGTLPTFSQGTKAAWAATVDSSTETLSFSWSANGDDTFTQGTLPSKAADSFTANVLPTLDDGTSVLTGVTAALAATPTFTGSYVKAAFTGSEATVTGSYSSTLASAGISKVEYLKQEINEAEFKPAAITLSVGTISVASKNVTVS